ncbi:MAG: alpha/beta fold hydrolase [Bacteroidetes bacterium]|nr:alpha/beta fold hydrolase [Bacteroidota bacterium]MCL5026288.1 alpha/beta fold hydrolase [Chloroflexota bacterium]
MLLPEHYTADRLTYVDPYRVRYWEAGSGPPVLLVHGLGTAAELWQMSIGPLSERFRVLVPDLPGFGLTDKPDGGYTLARGIHFLAEFLAERGASRASVVGNSMGGLLAAGLALEHSQMVERLVLVDTAGLGRDLGLVLRLLSLPGLGEVMAIPMLAALRWALGSLFYDPRRLPDHLVRTVHGHRCARAARHSLLKVTRRGIDLRGQRPEILLLDRLSGLQVPTLVIWGRQDGLIPLEHAYRARRAIPRCRLHIFEECGHLPMLEWPDEFNRVVADFLSQETGAPVPPSR